MKKLLIFCLALLISVAVFGQSRKYISQFSHLQSYYNPGLTAYEGSMVKTFVRNQWAGWEGAPKTYFVSAELDFSDFRGSGTFGKNAIGVNLLNDEYGAFRETELVLSYSTKVMLSENLGLRLGAGLNINHIRLDGNNLMAEQLDDQTINQYLGAFANMKVLDFNLGLSLTHPNYYLSYGRQNVNRGGISKGDVFMEGKPVLSVAQAGYRNNINDQIKGIINAMWRSQNDLPDNLEFNIKLLLLDKLWVGGGHRVNYANSAQLGLLIGKKRLGYVYEWPISKSYLVPNSTHEFMLSLPLFKKHEGLGLW
jgi:type IX secretion system PorP/SprF family membrane protein